MNTVDHKAERAASRRLSRAVSHLQQAGQQLTAATQVEPNRYHQQQLRRLTVDLRAIAVPIEGFASFLKRGSAR